MKKIVLSLALLTGLATGANAAISQLCITEEPSDTKVLAIFNKMIEKEVESNSYAARGKMQLTYNADALGKVLETNIGKLSIAVKNNMNYNFAANNMIFNLATFYTSLKTDKEKLAFSALMFKLGENNYSILKNGDLNEDQYLAAGTVLVFSNYLIESQENNRKIGSLAFQILTQMHYGTKRTPNGNGYFDPMFQNFISAILTRDFHTAKKVLKSFNIEDHYSQVDELCEKERIRERIKILKQQQEEEESD